MPIQIPFTRIRLPLPDGSYLWTDLLWRRGYRLQRRGEASQCRVVTPGGIRCAYGDEATCLEIFDRLAGPPSDEDPPQHIAVLLHGLLRTRRCMRTLEKDLLAQGVDEVVRFDYASSLQPIQTNAAALRRLIEGLPTSARISVVAHSMGNIVTRHAIGDWNNEGDPRDVLPRLHRMVMLGPPNQGAAIARVMSQLRLFGIVAGQGGLELGPHWDALMPRLAVPPCPFAIVAGDLSQTWLRNPLIDTASDLLVNVEEAKLAEASHFVTMPIIHTRLMTDRRVVEFVRDYLTADPKTLPTPPRHEPIRSHESV